MRRAYRLGLTVTFSLLPLVLAACGGGGGSSTPRTGNENGRFVTPGIDAPIYATMISDDTTRLVVVTDAQTLHAVFRGDSAPAGTAFSLANENGDSLDMAASGENYVGTLTAASGDTYDVTMEPVIHKNAGLYRGRENIFNVFWMTDLIFLNDGKVVGASTSEETGAVERRTSLDLGSKWLDPTIDPK